MHSRWVECVDSQSVECQSVELNGSSLMGLGSQLQVSAVPDPKSVARVRRPQECRPQSVDSQSVKSQLQLNDAPESVLRMGRPPKL